MGAADEPGDIYCLSTGLTAPISAADRAYFKRAIGTRDFGVGDWQIGRATGIQAIGLGFAVTPDSYFGEGDTGEPTGISLAPLALDWLDARINRRRSSRSIDDLVLDDHATVLARAGAVHTPDGTNIGSSKLARAIFDEDFGRARFRIAGERVDTAWGVVPISDGEVHVAVSVPR